MTSPACQMLQVVKQNNVFPDIAADYPKLRFMGSKYKLLPWIHEITSELDFDSVLDAFSGSGAVSYLFKAMGKRVVSNDFLHFPSVITKALIENESERIDDGTLSDLLTENSNGEHFIEETFRGIFFSEADLRFLDRVSSNIKYLKNPYHRALVLSAMIRSCVKRQPRGVFTVAGDPEKYKDGRRDLILSIEEHFIEQIREYNRSVFSNDQNNISINGDVFCAPVNVDLVYMDPPYIPRSDDNCYVKRYHFLEGLSAYWEGMEILPTSKVKKLKKPFTPFSYRKNAMEAFDNLFGRFSKSILVLSYSSNGYPDLDVLISIMKRHKKRVSVSKKEHRYHFGTHSTVNRALVDEYLIVGK